MPSRRRPPEPIAPKRDGKTVIFDAELSVNTVGTGITFGAAA